jgi:PAS domain S-box-containing protein
MSPPRTIADEDNAENDSGDTIMAANNLFLSKQLKTIAQLIAQNNRLRKAFIHFLYSRSWIDQYLLHEPISPNSVRVLMSLQGLDSYALPTGQPLVIDDHSSYKLRPQIFATELESTPPQEEDEYVVHVRAPVPTPHAPPIIQSPPTTKYKTIPQPTPRRRKFKSVPQSTDPTFGSVANRPPNMIFLLIAGVLPIFMQSEEFQHNLASELTSGSPQLTLVVPIHDQERQAQSQLLSNLESSVKGKQTKFPPLSGIAGDAPIGPMVKAASEGSRYSLFGKFVENNLNKISQQTLHRCLGSTSSWFADVTAYLERVPYSVTIASADSSHPGFPLIYGNKAFEAMTLYSRREFIGRNCRFLQLRTHTEKHQVEKISSALSEKRPIKVSLTNRRKNKETFMNMLSLLPVIDPSNNYVYVLGIGYDISRALGDDEQAPQFQQQVNQDLINIDNLLMMIHNILCH